MSEYKPNPATPRTTCIRNQTAYAYSAPMRSVHSSKTDPGSNSRPQAQACLARHFLNCWFARPNKLILSSREQTLIILRMGYFFRCDLSAPDIQVRTRKLTITAQDINAVQLDPLPIESYCAREYALLELCDYINTNWNIASTAWLHDMHRLSTIDLIDLIDLISQFMLFGLGNNFIDTGPGASTPRPSDFAFH